MEDPLNINIPLVGVETALPLLPEADYKLQCVESTVEANKERTGLNWNLKLVTTEPATAVDGRTVNPNFPLFVVISLPNADSKDVEATTRTICGAVDSLYGTDKTTRPDFNRETIVGAVGKLCQAHVTVDTWEGRDRNKIKPWGLKPLVA